MAIPIPKSKEELEAEAKDNEFYEYTKAFRKQLHVIAMIKERRDTLIQKSQRNTDYDELYHCE